jgi:hypothetical protein
VGADSSLSDQQGEFFGKVADLGLEALGHPERPWPSGQKGTRVWGAGLCGIDAKEFSH